MEGDEQRETEPNGTNDKGTGRNLVSHSPFVSFRLFPCHSYLAPRDDCKELSGPFLVTSFVLHLQPFYPLLSVHCLRSTLFRYTYAPLERT